MLGCNYELLFILSGNVSIICSIENEPGHTLQNWSWTDTAERYHSLTIATVAQCITCKHQRNVSGHHLFPIISTITREGVDSQSVSGSLLQHQ